MGPQIETAALLMGEGRGELVVSVVLPRRASSAAILACICALASRS